MGLRARRVLECRQLLTLALVHVSIICLISTPGWCHQDAQHITAILGKSVVFNCNVDFPEDRPVPYVLQWEKKGEDVPVYIWYENYPTHAADEYKGRVAGVSVGSNYGQASLNLTGIRETDQGWYECNVVFLNRSPNPNKNGTWFHLDVHAPPHFSVTPESVIYVNLGDAIILNCQAEGTPAPEILWYKDANPVEITATTGIFNDGTELRISNIRHEDIGDYTCIAQNGEGQISHTAMVIIAGPAVITVPPTNQTRQEGDKAEFTCQAKALPENVTVRWYREGAPVQEALEKRVDIRHDGSLVVNPVSAEDSGMYLCVVTNGIGDPQTASAYLNVEYPAKVTFTPTVQYLPFRLSGVVQCYIKANPPLQYVTWTKEKRLFEPYQAKDVVMMNNGSLLFTRVNENHGGRYSCTPYNAQGTQGSSGPMEVLVRKPPFFTVEPEPLYQRKVGDTVEMPCEAQEAEDTQKPKITWHRRDGAALPKNRFNTSGGNLTIENLKRTDFGYYQCVASNEVATIVTNTQLVVEGTQPHAPYNLSSNASEFAVTLSWLPGYSGGPDYTQNYTIWYREANVANWSELPVTPPGSTQVTINHLTPGTMYEFQVIGKNALGDGMLSKVIQVRTLGATPPAEVVRPNTEKSEKEFQPSTDTDVIDYSSVVFPTDSAGTPFIPPILRPRGPKPGSPRNLTVTEISNGFLISWQAPLERANLIMHYTIMYRTDAQWKTLNKGTIRAEETSYLVKNLVGGRTYHFRVLANSPTNYETSDEVKFPVPARVKHKAITAGVVGGILFFIVAIILSVCAVKICNKRKRRKQEKAYNMVACRITDTRNGGQPPGVSQVPLKKHRQGRIPGLTLLAGTARALNTLAAWVSRLGDSDSSADESDGQHLARIHRAPDGRFVLAASASGSNRSSVSSSSDDGGFLPKRGARPFVRACWRRPPSQLSLRSDGSGESGAPRHYMTTAIVHPAHAHHHYANQRTLVPGRAVPVQVRGISAIYSPRPRTGILATSTTTSLPRTPWSPVHNFSDLSSVVASTLPTPPAPGYLQLRSVHERYAQELPSLRAIHEQQQRLVGFPSRSRVPGRVLIPSPSTRTRSPPRIRIPPPLGASPWPESEDPPSHATTLPDEAAAMPTVVIRSSRSRLPPRHARHARSAPELSTARSRQAQPPHGLLMETSPQSRSSSSGFGSKNTSQQNQSSQSGSTGSSWRPPPYRAPPPAPTPSTSRPLAQDWLALTGLPPRPSPLLDPHQDKGCDVSVDGHYEFDAVFVGTPTREDRDSETYPSRLDDDLDRSSDSFTRTTTKYDNIEARVQAMKEEFAAFRQRQARRRRSPQLESVC